MNKILIGISLIFSISTFAIDNACKSSIDTLLDAGLKTGGHSKSPDLEESILNISDQELTAAGLIYKISVMNMISQKDKVLKLCKLDTKGLDSLLENAISIGYFWKTDSLDVEILKADDLELTREGMLYKYQIKNFLAQKEFLLR